MAKPSSSSSSGQVKLQLPSGSKKKVNWKGSKPGRKKIRDGEWVEHRARPTHSSSEPVYIVMRVKDDVPNLRSKKLMAAITAGIGLAATSSWERQKSRRRTFRVVHFAIAPEHLHLIVEATSTGSLSRGMQGLSSGLARRVNNQIGRKGSLFADRYESRPLESQGEVKKAIDFLGKLAPEREMEPVTEPKTSLLGRAK
jgi:putative transposase